MLKCAQPTAPNSHYYAIAAKTTPVDSLCYFLVRKDTLFLGKELMLSGWRATVLDAKDNRAALSFVLGNGKTSLLTYPKFNVIFLSGCGSESALSINKAGVNNVEVSIYGKATARRIK